MGAATREHIPRRIRAEVWNRDKGTCRYCRATNVRFELDHVRAHSKGGPPHVENLALACAWCNGAKGDGYREPLPIPEEWPEGLGPVQVERPEPNPSPKARVMMAVRLSADGVDALRGLADAEFKGNVSDTIRQLLSEALAAREKRR